MDAFFDHDRLHVYQAARQFNREIGRLLGELPRGNAESRSNLRRAAMSITRNIAEGSGKWKLPDKINFYHIARASATECAACLDEERRCLPGSEPALRMSRLQIRTGQLCACFAGTSWIGTGST